MTLPPVSSDRRRLVDLSLPVVALCIPLVAFFASKGMVVVLGIFTLTSLFDLIRERRFVWPFGRAVPLLVAALLAWSAASSLWEQSPGLALPKTLQLAGMAVGGAIAFAGCGLASPLAVRRAAWAMLLAIVIGLVVTVAERATSCRLTDFSYALRGRPPVDICWMFRYKIGVAVSVLFSAALLPLLWRRHRAIVLGLIALMLAAAVAAGSQTAAMAGTAGAVAFWVLHRWRRGALAVMAAAIVVVIGLAPVLATHLPTSRQVIEAWNNFPPSLVHRMTIWSFTGQRIIEHPILGWGSDGARAVPGGDDLTDVYSYHAETGRFLIAREPQLPLHPHNNGLQVWLELGAVGALLYTVLLLALMRRLDRLAPPHRRIASLTLYCMALTTGLASFGVWQSWWLATLWLAAGFVRAMTSPEPCAE